MRRLMRFLAIFTLAVCCRYAFASDNRVIELPEGGRIVGVQLSPNGKWIACVVRRPALGNPIPADPDVRGLTYDPDRLNLTDIYVGAAGDTGLLRVTDGVKTGYGYYEPTWSPDGRLLAMLSTRGISTPWVWNRVSNRLRQVTTDIVDYNRSKLVWLTNRDLIVGSLPPGTYPADVKPYQMATIRAAEAGWKKAFAGGLTARVLDAGTTLDHTDQPHGALKVVNVDTLKRTVLAEETAYVMPASQNGPAIVELLDQGNEYDTRRPMRSLPENVTLGLVDGGGLHRIDTPGFVPLTGLLDDLPTTKLQWSTDLSQVVVVGHATPSTGSLAEIRRYRIEQGKAIESSLPRINLAKGTQNDIWFGLQRPLTYAFGTPSSLLLGPILGPEMLTWSSDGRLVVKGVATDASVSQRRDWWIEQHSAGMACISCSLPEVPLRLVPVRSDGSFLAVSGSRFLRLQPHDYSALDLTPRLDATPLGIEWGSEDGSGDVVLRVMGRSSQHLVYWDQSRQTEHVIQLPDKEAKVAASVDDTIVLLNQEGTRLWLFSERTGQSSLRVAVTTVSPSAKGRKPDDVSRTIHIDYRGLKGLDLKAWLLLPSSPKATPPPVIVCGYPGVMEDADEPQSGACQFESSFLHNGYAVLYPSMPNDYDRAIKEPLYDLTDGVLPAIDRAAEMRLIDSTRVGFYGHSYGGYAAYGLVTQTNRFKAVVASAGISDLVSLYGTFNVYGDMGFAHWMPWCESGQVGMGVTPWEDLNKYLRNSPITHMNNVDTPLLIIQGDLDVVPIQQGEEVFSALRRQNKRVRFVQFLGEEHVIENPANVKNEIQEILNWFDEYLIPPAAVSKRGPQADGFAAMPVKDAGVVR